MAIGTISNNEAGSSVRGKLNNVIGYVNSPISVSTITATGSVTLSATMEVQYYGVSHSNAISITLPSMANDGKMVIIKDQTSNASSNNISVTSSVTIDNQVSVSLAIDNGSLSFIWNDSKWWIV